MPLQGQLRNPRLRQLVPELSKERETLVPSHSRSAKPASARQVRAEKCLRSSLRRVRLSMNTLLSRLPPSQGPLGGVFWSIRGDEPKNRIELLIAGQFPIGRSVQPE